VEEVEWEGVMEREKVLSSMAWLVRELKRRLIRSVDSPACREIMVADHGEARGVDTRGFQELPQDCLVPRDGTERRRARAATADADSGGSLQETSATPVERQIDLLRNDIARLQADLMAACHALSWHLVFTEGHRVSSTTLPPSVPMQAARNRQRFLDWVARERQLVEHGNGGFSARALGSGGDLSPSTSTAEGWESQSQSIVSAGVEVAEPAEPLAGPHAGNGSNGEGKSSPASPGATAHPSGTAPQENSHGGGEAEAKAWLERGVELTERGQYAGALQAYDRALCIRPDYIEAWLNKGVVLSAQRRYEKALRAYDEALRLSPNHPQIQYYKGIVLAKQERYREALAALDQALHLDASLVGAWSDKGFVLIRLGLYSDAIKACNEALRLEPQHRGARINRSRALNLQTRLKQRHPAASERRSVPAERQKRAGSDARQRR
jgi:tetratricopeptide (TPR) repeat protein